ncbi:MAG: PaREP1 family protein [Nitrososphaerales archaeon]
MGVTDVVKDAEEFFKEAQIELENGKANNDRILIRDSAEKGWNAIVQAVNALCEVLLGRIPKSHYDRRNALREIEKKFPELESLGLYDRYAARNKYMHGEVFYEGNIDIELLQVELEKTRKLIDDIKHVLQQKTS